MSYEEWLEVTGRENDEDTYYEYLAYADAMNEDNTERKEYV